MSEYEKALVRFVKEGLDLYEKEIVVVHLNGSDASNRVIDILSAAKIPMQGVYTFSEYSRRDDLPFANRKSQYKGVLAIQDVDLSPMINSALSQVEILTLKNGPTQEKRHKPLEVMFADNMVHYVSKVVNGMVISPGNSFNAFASVLVQLHKMSDKDKRIKEELKRDQDAIS